MPSHSDIPSDITSKKLLRAFKKSGFLINKVGGNGSHVKVIWPKNDKSFTIPRKMYKQNAKHYIEAAENISTVRWKDLKKKL